MEKVKLPREVAGAIEYVRNDLDLSDGNILSKCVRREWESIEMQILNSFVQTDNDKLTIAKALIIGYEVEQTPEDKVREYYKSLYEQMPNSHAAQSADTVVIVLDMLNIKIKGVND